MTTKTCFKCNETKPIDEFYAHPGMAEGRLNKCKDCAKLDVKVAYERAGGRTEYERRRARTPERRAAVKQCQEARRLREPEKYKAVTAVGNAIRDGRLVRGACEVCGSTQVQAHHDDYSKPLEVRWLCFQHHREAAHGQRVRSCNGEATQAG